MASHTEQDSLQRQAYLQITDMLMKGELSPGDSVGERRLATKLGLGRGPVREALLELQKEGLVQCVGGSKLRIVAELTFQDAFEIYELREILDGAAARLAALRIGDEALGKLAELARKLDVPGYTDRDEVVFHDTILQECGNSRLIEFARPVRVLTDRICFPTAGTDLHWTDTPVREDEVSHNDIVEALASHDADRAEALAKTHVREGREERIRRALG